MTFLDNAPRFLFFTGKGGVGKTSVASASAVALASRGRSVLLVSTDPASNVGQVFHTTIGNTITAIPGVDGLSALEIDPEEAAQAYRDRILDPVRAFLPDTEIATITETLSGSCTTEIASFDQFTSLLTDGATYGAFDHIVFDTAPTGHTIRLLQLPGTWSDFLDAGKGDPSCLGPLSGLEKHREVYAGAVSALTDPSRTRLVLVARAQKSSLGEIGRTFTELQQIGMTDGYVVVNGVLPTLCDDDELSAGVRARESVALSEIPSTIAQLPRQVIELKADNMVGVDMLASLFVPATQPALSDLSTLPAPIEVPGIQLGDMVGELAVSGRGLVMFMGKGGVGKTTSAAAVAVALARRGHDVHLTTTDPAAHLADTLQGDIPGLEVSRVDPRQAVEEYRDHVMATRGASLDDEGKAALREDLKSPCTEEVAVFRAFSEIVKEADRRFVIMDTAPTGHTLLLLDATGSYHREASRQGGNELDTPLMRLQDPEHTKMILVTLAETTPVLEAEGLQEDLGRAGIRPWGWIVNNSLTAARPDNVFLLRRAANEASQLRKVASLTARVSVVPMLAQEPSGLAGLETLTSTSLTTA